MKEISHLAVVEVTFVRKLDALKGQAHSFFDMLWKFGYIERNEAYAKLAEYMGITEREAHMKMMKEEGCKKVIEYAVMILNDMRRLDLDFGAPINHPYYEIVYPPKKQPKTLTP